jgi:hypothetical protein
MTKDRLRRLLDLKHYAGSGRALPDEAEYEGLKAEFEAWEPERNEAREAIRDALSLLEEGGCGCYGEPIPTAMHILSLALKEKPSE